MIEYVEGDIFDSEAQTIVNPVNTVGVMGKGLALEFKNRYPEMFEIYQRECSEHNFFIGDLMIFYYPTDHWVLLFPTKTDWRDPSSIEYIEEGLNVLAQMYEEKGITSIAFPKLGCGLGGLQWDDVRPVMEKYLDPLPIKVFVYTRYTINYSTKQE